MAGTDVNTFFCLLAIGFDIQKYQRSAHPERRGRDLILPRSRRTHAERLGQIKRRPFDYARPRNRRAPLRVLRQNQLRCDFVQNRGKSFLGTLVTTKAFPAIKLSKN